MENVENKLDVAAENNNPMPEAMREGHGLSLIILRAACKTLYECGDISEMEMVLDNLNGRNALDAATKTRCAPMPRSCSWS